jgi:hypothetical protein
MEGLVVVLHAGGEIGHVSENDVAKLLNGLKLAATSCVKRPFRIPVLVVAGLGQPVRVDGDQLAAPA